MNPTSLSFFGDFSPAIEIGTYQSSSHLYRSITSSIKNYADGFLRIIQKYTPLDGTLSEQFSRDDGTPLSAANLTWSYASFLTTVARRAGQVPISWSEHSRLSVSETCTATSARGSYAPAIPDSTCTKPAPINVALTFNVLKPTVWGQNIFLVGTGPQLGWFDEGKALPLSASTFTSSNPRWYVTVDLPAGTTFDYRYFLKEGDGTIMKEIGKNRIYHVPKGSCDGDVWIFDTFRA